MKKKLLLLLILLFPISVFASVNTVPRTADNLRVENWVEVTDENKDNILNTPSVNEEEKIYDFADLYTDEEEVDIYNKIVSFIDNRKLDLVVVTINENNKSDATEYADDFYDYNKFGLNDTRDGLLFLVDMDTRDLHITGTGVGEEKYPDLKIDDILDETFQDFSDGSYYEGTKNVIKTIDSYYDIEYNESGRYEPKNYIDYLLYIIIGSVVITVIVMIILVSKNRMVNKATSSREYLNEGTKEVKLIKNTLIGTHISKTKINHDNGSSGGGGGHIGSSGSSHSGGSHHF